MGIRVTYYRKWVWIGIFLFAIFCVSALPAADVLSRSIKLQKTTATRYQLLEKITTETGFHFIYSNSLFDDETVISFPGGKYSVQNAIYAITGTKNLKLQVVGSHILIQPPPSFTAKNKLLQAEEKEGDEWFTIEGRITDNYSHTPIPFVSVYLTGTSQGTISNMNGNFLIRVPDSLLHGSLSFSHLGYHPLQIENEVLMNGQYTFGLEPKVISLQEVIIRQANPLQLIEQMLQQRETNLAPAPVYFTSFYREGIRKRKNLLKLTEGVFKIYKSPYKSPVNDQVKLLKMREYQTHTEDDAIITRMKAGIHASLLLDIVKHLPDFLDLKSSANFYNYIYSDLTTIDDRLAYVVTFVPVEHIDMGLYKGTLYIDYENHALLKVEFEVDPKQTENVTSYFIEKKSRGLRIKAKSITYTISYKPWQGTYYVNHIRGDLHFQVRNKKQLFSTPLHTWYEMVTCDIETDQVKVFNRKEILYPRIIFSDTEYVYDKLFWENFNVILPEDDLSKVLFRINTKIDEIEK